MSFSAGLAATGRRLLQMALLGALVGLACWPFNLVDRWQDLLLQHLPAFSQGDWTPPALVLAALPLLTMPVLLALQVGRLRAGAGSGIPQTMVCVEAPQRAARLLAAGPTVQRLLLWSIASLSLLPLGREGPVVQMGAAVAHALRRRFPRLLQDLAPGDLIAVAGGAGLAAGFNTPLMATVFVAEELTSRFQMTLIWPALVISGVAAGVSNLGGQPMFALGLLSDTSQEVQQLLWAIPIGLLAGLVGALFGQLLLLLWRWLTPRIQQRPLTTGLGIGLALVALSALSGGASGGDGELLMHQLVESVPQSQVLPPLRLLAVLACRILGPSLTLAAGVPGGLIDPAFAIGALFGHGFDSAASLHGLGLAIGMTAALAGATQLPVISVLFALRLAGDQQLLPGLLLAAALGAYASRLLMSKPIYHVLTEPLQDSHAGNRLQA